MQIMLDRLNLINTQRVNTKYITWNLWNYVQLIR